VSSMMATFEADSAGEAPAKNVVPTPRPYHARGLEKAPPVQMVLGSPVEGCRYERSITHARSPALVSVSL